MAISWINQNTSLTATVTKPTNTADGDLCLIGCYRQATGGSTLAGWTQIFMQNGTSSSLTLLGKIASGEGASWTVTSADCTIANTLRGAGLPTNKVSAGAAATGTLNTLTANSWLVDCFACWNTTGAAAGHSTPAGYTNNGNVTEVHGAGNMRMSMFIKQTTTAVGSYSVTNTTASTVNISGLAEIQLPAVPVGSFFPFFDMQHHEEPFKHREVIGPVRRRRSGLYVPKEREVISVRTRELVGV